MNPIVSLNKSLLAANTVVFTLLGLSLGGCAVIPSSASEDGDIVITDDSCYEHCEARNGECSDIELNCRNICDAYEEMDCSAEVEEFESCRDDESDELCGAPAACDGKFNAVMECVSDYCAANPSATKGGTASAFCF